MTLGGGCKTYIHLYKTRLFGDLSGAGLSEIFSWTECPQHLDMAVSTASHALFDLLSKLLGKAADNERVGRLLKSLSDIESITPESHGFETLTKLLLLLTKVAVSSPIKYHSCEPLLKSLLYQLKTGWSCKIRKSEKENYFLICLPGLAACPLGITIVICLLATYGTAQRIRAHSHPMATD